MTTKHTPPFRKIKLPFLKDNCSQTPNEAAIDNLAKVGFESITTPPHHTTKERQANVLMLISKDFKVLLTRRSQNLRRHAGDVCLPGGRQDPSDRDAIATALREAKEEVGLSFTEDELTMLCRLPSEIFSYGGVVTPLVAYHKSKTAEDLQKEITINPEEVEISFWAPLSHFAYSAPTWKFKIIWDGRLRSVRKYAYLDPASRQTFSIWGFTATVLHSAAKLAYKPKHCK